MNKFATIALASTMLASSMTGVMANERIDEKIDEIKGNNRYDTAAKIAKQKKYNMAILVNTDKSLADGLSASGLAGTLDAPILLVKKDSIPKETKKALKNVKLVYIIGGENSISKNVENTLESEGMITNRISGNDRVDTSVKVGAEIAKLNKGFNSIFYVNGFKGEADAMSVAPVAARDKAPIILTNGKEIPMEPDTTIPQYLIGASGVMSNNIISQTGATRLAGKNRYETNKVIINTFFTRNKEMYLAKGDNLVDALTVSAMMKPVVLVSQNSDKSVTEKAEKLTAIGGISKSILNQLR